MLTPQQVSLAREMGREIGQALGRGGHKGGVVFPVPNLGNAPPGFADEYNNIFTRVIDLSVARVMEAIEITGNFIWVIDSTDDTSNLDVRFNDQRNSAITVYSGLTLGGFRFARAYITNAAQAGHTMTLLYGVQEPGTNLFINNPSAIVSTVSLTIPGTLAEGHVTLNAAGPLQIVAARANRREVFIQVATAARYINVGTNGVTAADGARIEYGATLILNTAAAVYGIASAAATDVRYLESYG